MLLEIHFSCLLLVLENIALRDKQRKQENKRNMHRKKNEEGGTLFHGK